MKVFHGTSASIGPTVVTVGAFAVVHRGHETLIERVKQEAGRLDATAAVVTFDPHPQEVLRPDDAPCRLATLEQRLESFEERGVGAAVVIPFDRALAELSPDEFVRHALVDGLSVRKVIVGEDFRFGHRRAGDIALLRSLGSGLGFDVEPMPLLPANGGKVSSSEIRRLIESGDVEGATALLGSPYRVAGEVVRGEGRGRGIGFPTANVSPGERVCLPAIGVYAAWWRWEGKRLPGVVNVGVRPTFTPAERPVVEIHVFDIDEDLYGRRAEVEFAVRLRDELRFESVDALVEQMHKDALQARRLLV